MPLWRLAREARDARGDPVPLGYGSDDDAFNGPETWDRNMVQVGTALGHGDGGDEDGDGIFSFFLVLACLSNAPSLNPKATPGEPVYITYKQAFLPRRLIARAASATRATTSCPTTARGRSSAASSSTTPTLVAGAGEHCGFMDRGTRHAPLPPLK